MKSNLLFKQNFIMMMFYNILYRPLCWVCHVHWKVSCQTWDSEV